MNAVRKTKENISFALRLDDTSTANVTYVGKALPSSDESQSVWQISKIDQTSGVSITWADGDELFNNVWSDRVSLTYI